MDFVPCKKQRARQAEGGGLQDYTEYMRDEERDMKDG